MEERKQGGFRFTDDALNTTGGIPFASIVDSTTTAGYIYFCDAAPGTATSAASWRISRMNTTTGQTMWADGNANFDNIADNRASLSYS